MYVWWSRAGESEAGGSIESVDRDGGSGCVGVDAGNSEAGGGGGLLDRDGGSGCVGVELASLMQAAAVD